MFVCVCAVCFRQPDKKLGVKVLIFWVLRASDWQDMQILYNNVWETTAGGGFGSFIGAPWSVSFDAVSPRRWHLFNSNSTPEPPTLMSWHGIPPLFRFSGLAPSGMGIGIATLRLAGVCYGMESKWTVMVWRAQASRIYVIFNFSLQNWPWECSSNCQTTSIFIYIAPPFDPNANCHEVTGQMKHFSCHEMGVIERNGDGILRHLWIKSSWRRLMGRNIWTLDCQFNENFKNKCADNI